MRKKREIPEWMVLVFQPTHFHSFNFTSGFPELSDSRPTFKNGANIP